MPLKSILVTGCSGGGIGSAIALLLARKGHHVFATARNTSKIPEELTSLSNVTVLSLDVTSMPSVKEAAKAVSESGHGLDVLVNNAGIGYVTPILDMDIEEAKRVHDTNLWGSIRMIQAFKDLLIASHGRIVNIISIGALLNLPWHAAYCSAKIAMANISETLRLELAPFGVNVVAVMAGTVATKFDANCTEFTLPSGSLYASIKDYIAGWVTGTAKPPGGSVDEFAQLVHEDIVGKGRNGVVYRGENSGMTAFVVNWFPRWIVDKLLVSQNSGLPALAKIVS
ncbi:oxidoreductase, short-chain dehydrogenase/reductase family [Talaromyces stipitatus ATCC 10500]|uniref:Oxidoreductase, short-chain dehydrogenase/reductase family n=1 Tax=Talaromyces stipitatus (strain ATCC 10500 / CBS 375.48 / QM 6759 / NRRL 1006) TaxID=441959 RepID=B8MTQ6_TALSN|nr:oxidoreductase, short-chain dehydrogenase/reductase family [Talaromyces stipitatus ATCC 10500]EED12541.1 oxidoreductase, short-chain dehydrogenase/reductase family [Talaromyces stipitatus ATCC 10500]